MKPAVPLFDRLPEIYRIRDAEQAPPGQLRAYLDAIATIFDALHADIGRLYDDFFIDTCQDWVVPYLADLLGTTHLKGDARTLRADVADTIALRRRKGTRDAIERLAVNLTGWACRAVELRENLAWSQHLNHLRPDPGGASTTGTSTVSRFDVPRGGTAPVRDPAALALVGGPFDTLSYTADVKPAIGEARHINLPNLAVFVWRLTPYPLPLTVPIARGATNLGPPPDGQARFAARFDLHPLGLPVTLFNTSHPGFRRAEAVAGHARLTGTDDVPGPIPDARLTTGSPAGHPEAYVRVAFYDDAATLPEGFAPGDVGLHLFLRRSLEPLLVPAAPATEWRWRFRGDNLCGWEAGLRRPLGSGEIVIDPAIGRVLVGLDTSAQVEEVMSPDGTRFASRIFTSFTAAAPGPVGALPITRATPHAEEEVERRTVGAFSGGGSLDAALHDLDTATRPIVIEIADSLVHRLDLAAIPGTSVDGSFSLRLAHSLTIRAVGGHRPMIELTRPLAFRPVAASGATIKTPIVRLEGLYLCADESAPFPAADGLISRAAVARLEIIDVTLAPGGHPALDGTRAPTTAGLRLDNDYGFADPADVRAFLPTPDIIVQRSITGTLAVDSRYHLDIEDSIVDGGLGINDEPDGRFAICAASNPDGSYAARLDFSGLTCFGPVRVSEVGGQGGLFTQRFEVLDDQHGCIKWSWFSGNGDRLPPNHFCLNANEARLAFTSERFSDPGYGQIARACDPRVLTLGPADDAMGAFGFLLEAHKWTNLQVRLREFMPVGVRPLVVPVT